MSYQPVDALLSASIHHSQMAVLSLPETTNIISRQDAREKAVVLRFVSGDDLIFQLESGYGLLRVLAVEEGEHGATWHLLAYEELFPDVEAAEAALAVPGVLHPRVRHMALTDRAFERTPAALLGNRPVTEEELKGYREWQASDEKVVSDRSALLMLGIR
jgi:hypothetical protein